MTPHSARNIAIQLYGLLVDLADGQEVHPDDAPFLDEARVSIRSLEGVAAETAGIVVRTRDGQVFHLAIQELPEPTPTTGRTWPRT
jgi:hypothetical protein